MRKNTLRFEDNQGRILDMDAGTRISTLARKGIRIRLARPDDPLPDNWYVLISKLSVNEVDADWTGEQVDHAESHMPTMRVRSVAGHRT